MLMLMLMVFFAYFVCGVDGVYFVDVGGGGVVEYVVVDVIVAPIGFDGDAMFGLMVSLLIFVGVGIDVNVCVGVVVGDVVGEVDVVDILVDFVVDLNIVIDRVVAFVGLWCLCC